MQQLTGADVIVRDQLFATVDTTTRRMNGTDMATARGMETATAATTCC